ncbi:MAG: carotenoid oxygenase family protein [Myxococcota bacterium]
MSAPPLTAAQMKMVLQRSMRTAKEHPDPIPLPVVEGAVPSGLRGVLWRNGGGRFERGGVSYGHPFDGDGMISRFAFADGTVRFRSRFVRTREYRVEDAADAICFRGFGTNKPGGIPSNIARSRFKNAANTNIVPHAGRLMALWEGGLPHLIAPGSLETRARYSFDGALKNRRSPIDALVNPELAFSAHPRLDEETGELVNFGLVFGLRSRLMLYRISADGVMAPLRSIPLPALSFTHDFALTRRWQIFFLPAVRFDIPRALLGLASPVQSLQIREDEPMEIWLVPRDGGAPVRIAGPPGFIFHVAHAYEDDHGNAVVDGMWLERFPDLTDLPRVLAETPPTGIVARPVRYVLDPKRRTCQGTPLSTHGAELPRIAPGHFNRPAPAFWATTCPPGRPQPFFTGLGRFDAARQQVVARDFGADLPSEPIFAPNADGDGGWVLSVLFRAQGGESELLILDPDTLETVARLAMPHHLPPGFHGSFLTEEKLPSYS